MENKTRPGHLWQPGQSGNPGGRPKGRKEFPFLLKDIQHHFNLWKELVETGKMSDPVRMRAARDLVQFMADRFWGKPAQALDLNVDKPLAAIVNINLGEDGSIGLPSSVDPERNVIELKPEQPAINIPTDKPAEPAAKINESKTTTENNIPNWIVSDEP